VLTPHGFPFFPGALVHDCRMFREDSGSLFLPSQERKRASRNVEKASGSVDSSWGTTTPTGSARFTAATRDSREW